MIDEKGRLFGKINLIDLLVIIVVIAAVTFLGFKFLGSDVVTGDTQEVTLSVYCEETSLFVLDKLTNGSEVYDFAANVILGTLAGWQEGESESYGTNSSGIIIQHSKDGYRSLNLDIECAGIIGPHGVTIDGTLYGIGHSMIIYVGVCKLFIRVSDINVTD